MQPSDLLPSKLLLAIKQAEKVRSRLTDEMIDNMRGLERPSETRHKTDPLSRRINANADLLADLLAERDRRLKWSGTLKRIKLSA